MWSTFQGMTGSKATKSPADLVRGNATTAAPADYGTGAPRATRKNVSAGRFSTSELIGLVMIPWLTFLVVCLLFAFAYHYVPAIVWLVIIGGLGICASQVRQHMKDRSHGPFPLFTSGLCLVALIASTITGITTYDEYIGNYWYYTEGHSYVNVLPTNNAGGYADAGMLVFADESRVDTNRAMGYQEGQRFCVAPIIDDSFTDQVQFWAAGVDCCANRGGFHCDDAWNPKARSAVVIRDLSRAYGLSHEEYNHAVKQAEAAFEIVSAPDAVFVRWVIDPELVTLNCWRLGCGILLVATMIYLLISATSACVFQSAGFK